MLLIMRVRFQRPTEVGAVNNTIMPSPTMLAVDAAKVAVVVPVNSA